MRHHFTAKSPEESSPRWLSVFDWHLKHSHRLNAVDVAVVGDAV
jgi:hypothetical protein